MNKVKKITSRKVAIIMSVYKSDDLEYLKIAVNSIMVQSYDDFILFIYRDGYVPVELDEYLGTLANNPKIRLTLAEKNLGLAFALNYLIDEVTAQGSDFKYIARMDSDDISRVERLNRQVQFLEQNRCIDVCGTSCREFGASFAKKEKHLPQTHQVLLDFSITKCPFIHPSVMFRKAVFNSGVRYPTNTFFTEDMALWFVLLNNGFKFGNLNEILLDYRLNENTVRRRKGWKKGNSEFKLRFSYMFILRKVSVKNLMLVFLRLAFHILPEKVLKYLYRNYR